MFFILLPQFDIVPFKRQLNKPIDGLPGATRKRMPVWVEAGLLDYDTVYLNGGRRGYLISVASSVLSVALGAKPVTVALGDED